MACQPCTPRDEKPNWYIVRPIFSTKSDKKFKCVKCHEILQPPVQQTQCGHRICEKCSHHLLRQDRNAKCPANTAHCVYLAKVGGRLSDKKKYS